MRRVQGAPLIYIMQEVSIIGLVRYTELDIAPNGREHLRVEVRCQEGRGEKIRKAYYTAYIWQTFLKDQILPGSMIYVQGRLRARAYIDKEGRPKPSLSIYGNNVYLLGDPYNFTNFEETPGGEKYEKGMGILPEVAYAVSTKDEEEEDPEDFFGKNGEYPF